MEVTKSIREFKYNGVALQDPSPKFTLEQVREFYSTLYPEIINAAIEGPTAAGAKTIYEFRRAVGTKGADIDIPVRVERLLERRKARSQPMVTTRRHESLHFAVSNVARGRFGTHLDDAVLPDSRTLPLLP